MPKVSPERDITPERWVAVQVETDEDRYIRVISGWQGSYLDGSSYRLSSPIVEEREDGHNIYFSTESGSTYVCNRNAEGMTTLTSGIYHALKDSGERAGIKIKLLAYGDPT